MKINAGSLPLGVRKFSFVSEAGVVGLDERFTGDVNVSVRAEKTKKFVELNTVVKVTAEFVCDRCAERFTREMEASYLMVYLFRDEDSGGYPEDSIALLPSENTVIDITDDVRQYTLLQIPLKVLCREDCKGLCIVCGVNRNTGSCSCTETNIDPRWDQLNKLLKHK